MGQINGSQIKLFPKTRSCASSNERCSGNPQQRVHWDAEGALNVSAAQPAGLAGVNAMGHGASMR